MRRSTKRIDWRMHLTGYLFIAPWLAGMLLFTLGPVVASFALAFFHWDFFTEPRFIGWANFTKLSWDPLFLQTIFVTFYYTAVAVPLGILVALGLALLVNYRMRGVTVYRTILFLPNIVAGVAMMLVWRWLFNPDFGLINQVLDLMHVTTVLEFFEMGRPQWLSSSAGAMPALILMSLWGVGTSMMIILAGLQSVPVELTEAAELDGAGPWKRFIHVTLPLLTPTLFFLLIMGFIGGLQVFGQAYVMTGGGPANATLFYTLYLFRNAFQLFNMGYACAMALLLFLAILALTLVQLRLSRRWVYYQ